MHANGGRFHGDLLGRRSDFEFEVEAGAVADREDDIVLFNSLKTCRIDSDAVVADGEVRSDVLAIAVGNSWRVLAGFGAV